MTNKTIVQEVQEMLDEAEAKLRELRAKVANPQMATDLTPEALDQLREVVKGLALTEDLVLCW